MAFLLYVLNLYFHFLKCQGADKLISNNNKWIDGNGFRNQDIAIIEIGLTAFKVLGNIPAT